MHKLLIISFLFAVLPYSLFSQKRTKLKDGTINISTTINYYPALEPFSFFTSFTDRDEDLILNFITSTSGTFTLEPGETLFVERINKTHIPTPLLGIGASVQFVNQNGAFQEFSLTKLAASKSTHFIEFSYVDSLGMTRRFPRGFDQNAFAFGLRYEYGKYFGKRKSAKAKFGISGAIEPSLYFYKWVPVTSNEYPIKANLMTIDFALIPMLAFKLAKKVSLDFKLIPSLLVADFGTAKENNPSLTLSQQEGEQEYNLPEISLAFSILLRYQLKEPKKRGRR